MVALAWLENQAHVTLVANTSLLDQRLDQRNRFVGIETFSPRLVSLFPISSVSPKLIYCAHPKLRNSNLHNIIHSLISWNPMERMFRVQISLLIVTILFLISQILPLMQTTKEVSHTLALCHVSICGVPPYSSSYVTCWMSVHAYATSPMKAHWRGPHQRRWEENKFKFHNLTCYTYSIVSLIHVNTTKLRNITCTLVATGVILRSLECSMFVWRHGFSITCSHAW